MRGDERFELGDELMVAAERKVGLDALLERAQAQLVEASGLGPRERLGDELGERGAAPEL